MQMRQSVYRLTAEPRGKGLTAIAKPILTWVMDQSIETGLLVPLHLGFAHRTGECRSHCARGHRALFEVFVPEVQIDMHMTTRDPTTCPRICARC